MPTIGSDIFKQLDDLISVDVGSRGVDKLHMDVTTIEGGPTCMKAAETLWNSVQTKLFDYHLELMTNGSSFYWEM